MSHTTTLTIQVPSGIEERLDQLAKATSRTKSWLAQEALKSFVDLYDWQVQSIQKGLVDAEAGAFVDHERVADWLESWGTEDELPPPQCD